MKLRLEIIGYIGKDATIIANDTENATIQFTVAHTEKYTDRYGTKTEKTTWVSCFYRRKAGQTGLAQYLKKGTIVCAEGTPSVNVYTDRGGITRANISLAVSNVTLISTKLADSPASDTQTEPNPTTDQYVSEPTEEHTDLPF